MAGLVVVAAGLASADSIQVQNLFFPSGSDITSWTATDALNQFNNQGGSLTLEWIQFELVGSVSSQGAATDSNPGSTGTDTYTFEGDTHLSFSDPADTNLFHPIVTQNQVFTNQGLGSVMTAGPLTTSADTGNARYFVDPTLFGFCANPQPGCESGFVSTGHGSVDPLADYANYIGTGTINETVAASTFPAFAGASFNTSSGSGTADMELVVTYDYIPTPPPGAPEPTTMALMGGALLGLGLIGRRLRKG